MRIKQNASAGPGTPGQEGSPSDKLSPSSPEGSPKKRGEEKEDRFNKKKGHPRGGDEKQKSENPMAAWKRAAK